MADDQAAEEIPLVVGGLPNAESTDEVTPEPGVGGSEAPIKIGDREFTDQKEAWAYAEGLEKERLANDSYRQGVQDTMNQQPVNAQAQAPVQEDNFDEKFYENPKKYLNDMRREIKEEVNKESAVERQQAQTVEKLWHKFYNDYPDLQGKDKLVKVLLEENWNTIGHMQDSTAAMKILAGKTRAELQGYIEAAKPTTELTNNAGGASGGSQSQVTPKEKEEPVLNFIDQLNKLNDRRA